MSARVADHAVPPYRELAEAYDIVHRDKPYSQEARAVRDLARRSAGRPLRSLLDVACGSGRHLEHFARWFDATGVDASTAMLSRARRRVPAARLVRGRMESFDLGTEFDVVTCLFSAIAYVRSVPELHRTVRNLARHTAPGGVVVVEPFVTPRALRRRRIDHVLARSGNTTVARMNGSRLRRGRVIFDFHFLVGREGTVKHFVETHDCGLFDRRTMTSAFRRAGLHVRYLRGGLPTRRGLYVGLKPAAEDALRGGHLREGRSRRPEPR